MDQTTHQLIQAIELLLTEGHQKASNGQPDRWMFQQDSEIHIVLQEAIRDARLTTGLLSIPPETEKPLLEVVV